MDKKHQYEELQRPVAAKAIVPRPSQAAANQRLERALREILNWSRQVRQADYNVAVERAQPVRNSLNERALSDVVKSPHLFRPYFHVCYRAADSIMRLK